MSGLRQYSSGIPISTLVLEGHALNIYLDGPQEDKEEAILGPLTEQRASNVRDALIAAGIDPGRISLEAHGGQFPIVSVTDKTVWWKKPPGRVQVGKK